MCGYRIQIEFGGPASQKGAREAFSVAGRVVFHLPATLDSAGMGFSVAGAAESKSNRLFHHFQIALELLDGACADDY